MSSDSGQNLVIFINLRRHGLISQAPAVIENSLSSPLCDMIKLNHGLLIVNGTYFLVSALSKNFQRFKELQKSLLALCDAGQ